MTDWNYDMSAAPKGQVRATGEFIPPGMKMWGNTMTFIIIAADGLGNVGLSRWLINEERWLNFNKANPPIAWQPWPDHPEVGK